MAEFIRTEEKVVNVGEPIIFENNTDSDFSVSAAIVFRKSGLYDVSIEGRRTIISKVAYPEIIRCKNCKYNANPSETGNANCDLFYGMTDQYGFCHRAERRADGNT